VKGALVITSVVYWLVAIILSYLAVFAPCGITPGSWCETEGPNLLGVMLGFLGPVGVLAFAAVIYAASVLVLRLKGKTAK
jgi:hypothetical protein